MKKKTITLLVIGFTLVTLFVITAFAANPVNGITVSMSTSTSSSSAFATNKVTAPSTATITAAYISVYNAAGTRVNYNGGSGSGNYYSYKLGTNWSKSPNYAVGSSSAKINGSYLQGGTATISFS